MMCCAERGYILGLTLFQIYTQQYRLNINSMHGHIQWINANQKIHKKNLRHTCLFNFDHAIRHSFTSTPLEHYSTRSTFKFSFNLIAIRNSNIGRYYSEICHIWLILFKQFLNFWLLLCSKILFSYFPPFKVVQQLFIIYAQAAFDLAVVCFTKLTKVNQS